MGGAFRKSPSGKLVKMLLERLKNILHSLGVILKLGYAGVMTRINSAIPPANLCDQHLLAEYRELPRVSALAWKWYERENKSEIPSDFRLGTGHVSFFYDKGGFLKERFDSIVETLEGRGFDLQFKTYRPHPDGMNGYYKPSSRERVLLEERITLRMPSKPRWGKKS